MTGHQGRGEDDAVLIVVAVVIIAQGIGVWLTIGFRIYAGTKEDARYDDVSGSIVWCLAALCVRSVE